MSAHDPYRDGVSPADEQATRPAPLHDDRPVDVRIAEREGSPGEFSSRDPDQLQDEIEVLQNRMAERLDRVTTAFTPQNLIAQVTGERNPDMFTTLDTVVDTARRNPVAAALIGAGMAQLLLGGRRDDPREEQRMAMMRSGEYGVEGMGADGRLFAASGTESLNEYDDAYGDDMGASRDMARDPETVEGMERSVRKLQDRAAARLSAATSALSGMYRGGRTRAEGVYDRTRRTLVRTERDDGMVEPGAVDWVKENPVPIGLAALAVGALAAGYYTASKPKPQPGRLPRDRALVPYDDMMSVEDEYLARHEPSDPPMPVSAAAPTPMGAELRRTAPIGGSGQIGGTRDTGSSAMSTPSRDAGHTSGGTAETVVRDADRKPEGAGFGSTAASRGEVESKPSEGYQPRQTESTLSRPALVASGSSSTSGASTNGASTNGSSAANGANGAQAGDGLSRAGSGNASMGNGSLAAARAGDADTPRYGSNTSSATEDLTSIYRPE